MKQVMSLVFACCASLAGNAIAAEPTPAKGPYTVDVWVDLSFDDKAQLNQIQIVEKERLPKPFVNFVMSTVASGSFNPPDNALAMQQFETSLRIVVEIDPATSKARFVSQEMMPRPLRPEHQVEPMLRVKGEWAGRILVRCTISTMGRCGKPKIDQTMNVPNLIYKVLLSTLGAWQYVPQKRAGVPVEGEFSTWMTIESDTASPPKDFVKGF